MNHKHAVPRNLDHVARHSNDCRGGPGPAVDLDRDFRFIVFQAGINGICGEYVAAAAVDSYDDFINRPQRVQFIRKLPRGYFVAPPRFGSNIAVKNQFRGGAFLCRGPERPKMLIDRLLSRRVLVCHLRLPPLTTFLPVSAVRRFGKNRTRSFP